MNFNETPIGRCVNGVTCPGCAGLVPQGQGVLHGDFVFCGESCFRQWEDYMNGDDPEEQDGCQTCWGRGEIVTCIDDMCHGQEECIHGDGYSVCPDCGGHG